MKYLIIAALLLIFLSLLSSLVRNLIRKSPAFYMIPAVWIIMIFLLKPVFNLSADSLNLTGSFFNGIYYLITAIIFLTDITLLCYNGIMLKNSVYTIYQENKTFNLSRLEKPLRLIFQIRFNHYRSLEIKLLLRNKRLRNVFVIPVFMILLTYYLFSTKKITDIYSLLFWFTGTTGILGYSLAQYLFSWESSYFELISAVSFDFKKYLQAKYLISIIFSVIISALLIPAVILYKIDLHLLSTALLYNIGIGYFMIYYTATYNDKRMDLNYSILFNYQGNNGLQIFSISSTVIIPLLMILIFKTFLNQTLSLLLLNAISLCSLLNYNSWFEAVTKQLVKRKYINLEGYRK